MSNVYAILKCNLGEGDKTYLFTGNTMFSKLEAREVNEKGDVVDADKGISIPINHYKEIRKANNPHHRGTFITSGT